MRVLSFLTLVAMAAVSLPFAEAQQRGRSPVAPRAKGDPSVAQAILAVSSVTEQVVGNLGTAAAVCAGITAVVAPSCIRIVGVGEAGVQHRFGAVAPDWVEPGLHFRMPWTRISTLSTKSKTVNYLDLETLTSEGLSVSVDVAVTYRIDAASAVQLFRTVGTQWKDVLLHPQVRSTIRGVVAGYTSKELYDTAARASVAEKLYSQIKNDLEPRGIVIEAVPLRAIHLPKRVSESIENKLRMEQENERMAFVLQKEEQEAQRKSIEAQGIAEFQRIVSEGISDQLLKWKGIETTKSIAESDNAKIVIVGTGENGLPVIFNSA